MSATKAEQIVDMVVATIGAIHGTGPYDVDLRGRAFSADNVNPIAMLISPTVVVAFDAIDPGDGLRERSLTVAIDVFVEADYAAARGVASRALLLRIRSDIETAIYASRYSGNLLSRQQFDGSTINQPEDGATLSSLTMRFRFTYIEERAA